LNSTAFLFGSDWGLPQAFGQGFKPAEQQVRVSYARLYAIMIASLPLSTRQSIGILNGFDSVE